MLEKLVLRAERQRDESVTTDAHVEILTYKKENTVRTKIFFVVFVLASIMLAACGAKDVPTGDELSTELTEPRVVVVTATPAPVKLAGIDGLESPRLHHAGEHPAGESSVGMFDIGVNEGQYGLVFGWNLAWGAQSIPGEGCELVVLVSGWYEDFEITDGRYEVYDLPAADPSGWAEVLLSQRIEEQATHYGCPADKVPPVWEGGK